MEINIDGQSLIKPAYSEDLPAWVFSKLVSKARVLEVVKPKFDRISFEKMLEISADFDLCKIQVLTALVDDDRLDEIAISVVQQLRSSDAKMRREAAVMASNLANDIEDPVVLTASPKNKGPFPSGLGHDLRSGSIHYRGHVAQISGLKGGKVRVGGEVGKVEDCESGLVFIKGDLVTLGNTKGCGVIVSGRIDSVEGDDNSRVAMAIDGPQHPTVTIFKRLSRWGFTDNIDNKLGDLKATLTRQVGREVRTLDTELAELHRKTQEVRSRQGYLNSRLSRINALG